MPYREADKPSSRKCGGRDPVLGMAAKTTMTDFHVLLARTTRKSAQHASNAVDCAPRARLERPSLPLKLT